MRFEPRQILRTLNAHSVRYLIIGNLGAVLHGSPINTRDADICPSPDPDNLERLAEALLELRARIRASGVEGGLPFTCDATFLRQMKMVNLTTAFGDLDLAFEPSGTGGYADLSQRQVVLHLRGGLDAPIASLEDIIRSKEAAGREKDRLALPTLRALLAKFRTRGQKAD